jgi:hypothetical protein
MREHLFGSYGEYIPITDNASRCPSVPLPSSYAEPITMAPTTTTSSSCCGKPPSTAYYYAHGQKLTGNMIMRLNSDEDEHVMLSDPE